MSLSVSVKVWGEFALFTRPELKVERLSYPMMTPSAARGVLDAILYCRDSGFPVKLKEGAKRKRHGVSTMNKQDTSFRLDKADRRKIEQLRKKEKDSRIYSRYLALLWLDDGKSVDEVAARLDRDPSTIRKWIKLFEKKDSTASVASLIAAIPET